VFFIYIFSFLPQDKGHIDDDKFALFN